MSRSARLRSGSARLVALGVGVWLGLAAPGEAAAFVWPNVPERIAKGLEAADAAERRSAAAQIGDLPAELARPLVLRAMGDEDAEVRIVAARTAARMKVPGAGDVVVPWLSETDSRVRLAACEVVRAVPTPRSITALGRVLSDPSQDVRLAAASAMGRSGSADAASLLLGHLDDNSPEVRSEVAQALGRLGDKRAALPLVGRVQDASSDVRRRVAHALGELGDPRAVSALVLALNDPSSDVRVEAAESLGRIGTDDATVALAPLVRSAATDPTKAASAETTHALRQAALRALGRIGSPRAIGLLVASLEDDRPDVLRAPARDALVLVGAKAVPSLVAVVSGAPSQRVATGAVQALGAIGDPSSVPAIVRGMQRGNVPLVAGLGALADLRSDAALPAVLELVIDQPREVRRVAIETATTILDPSRPDGRPIDPVREALADPTTSLEERVLLAGLLGRTGSARAAEVLLPLVTDKQVALKRAAIQALGGLSAGSRAIDAALTAALDDELANVRMDAAVALSRVGSADAAGPLLDRLTKAAEQDRGALGVAIAGVLSRSRDAALADRAGKAVPSAPVEARDALIEGLGRMGTIDALTALTSIATGPADDRRKVSESLASHGVAGQKLLIALSGDGDSSVRATAAWSLGFAGDAAALTALAGALDDADATVAGNAIASIGRLAGRVGDPAIVTKAGCRMLDDARPHVRANALAALDLGNADCPSAPALRLLVSDPSEIVRLAAARHLHRVLASAAAAPPAAPAAPPPSDPPKPGDAPRRAAPDVAAPSSDRDRVVRALARCASEESTFRVARTCERAPVPAAPGGPFPLAVFIVPDGATQPVARAPFTLVLPDGTMRLGLADRRGAIFEPRVPPGDVELGVPAPLLIERP